MWIWNACFFSNLILGFKREKSTVFIYYFFLPHQKKDDGWHFSRFTLICFICNTQHVCVRIFFYFIHSCSQGFFHTQKKNRFNWSIIGYFIRWRLDAIATSFSHLIILLLPRRDTKFMLCTPWNCISLFHRFHMYRFSFSFIDKYSSPFFRFLFLYIFFSVCVLPNG